MLIWEYYFLEMKRQKEKTKQKNTGPRNEKKNERQVLDTKRRTEI